MRLRTCLLLTTVVFLLFASFNLLAREQNNPLVEAIKLYDQVKYAEAEKILKTLLDENPEHLMVNYFYGACRTENGRYGQNEISYLLKGSTGESPLKSNYYLAVQHHAQNLWDNALQYYNAFKLQSDSKEQAELGLDEKIWQCENHINPFEVAEETNIDIAPVPVSRTNNEPESEFAPSILTPAYPGIEKTDSLALDTILTDSVNNMEMPEITVPKSLPKLIDFKVNGEMTYLNTTNFQTKEGLNNFLFWEKSAKKLDLLKTQTDGWRTTYANATTSSERNELGNKIIAAEEELFSLQKETKNYRTLALKAENDFWSAQPETSKTAFIKQLGQQTKSLNEKVTPLAEKTDSTLIIPQELVQNLTEPITTTEEQEANELIYKIQIGAFSRGLPSHIKKQFDKLSYIRKIENYTDDRGVVVYTTGNLTRLEDAVKMQNQVRQEGIEDAFVVPYFNGKRITLEEAKKIEKENDN